MIHHDEIVSTLSIRNCHFPHLKKPHYSTENVSIFQPHRLESLRPCFLGWLKGMFAAGCGSWMIMDPSSSLGIDARLEIENIHAEPIRRLAEHPTLVMACTKSVLDRQRVCRGPAIQAMTWDAVITIWVIYRFTLGHSQTMTMQWRWCFDLASFGYLAICSFSVAIRSRRSRSHRPFITDKPQIRPPHSHSEMTGAPLLSTSASVLIAPFSILKGTFTIREARPNELDAISWAAGEAFIDDVMTHYFAGSKKVCVSLSKFHDIVWFPENLANDHHKWQGCSQPSWLLLSTIQNMHGWRWTDYNSCPEYYKDQNEDRISNSLVPT